MLFKIITALIIILLFIIIINQALKIKKLSDNNKVMIRVKEILYSVTDKMNKIVNIDDAYECIMDASIKLIPRAQKGSILIMESDGKFHFKAIRGFSQELKEISLSKNEAFLFKINNFNEAAIIDNPLGFDEKEINKDNAQKLKNIEALEIISTISCPIYIDGKLLGLLNVDGVNYNDKFIPQDLEIINYIKNEFQLSLKTYIIREKLSFMANFDELTRIYNRRYFNEQFFKKISEVKRYSEKAYITIIDIDNFKNINDTYGHMMGDKTLIFFTQSLKLFCNNNDIYGRMSGDEFIIFSSKCSRKDVDLKIKTFRDYLKAKDCEGIFIDFSYGVSEIDGDVNQTPDEIFGEADRQMYNNKKCKGFER